MIHRMPKLVMVIIAAAFFCGCCQDAVVALAGEAPADTGDADHFDEALRDVEEIVFAARPPSIDPHWYANFGHYAYDENARPYRDGGRLCKLDVGSGQVTTLLDDPGGTVRDPVVHYNGETILFSYRPGDTRYFHLYEIKADGTGLRQLTDGPYHDIEPIYLPSGELMFVSSRCNRWVNCWLTRVAILYRCDGDGEDIRPVSANIEHDNTPWVLPDGQILYTRWEYVDRSQVDYHHLWMMAPDGSRQTVYFGNLHPGVLMIDAKPIPGSRKIVASFSPGHGRKDHAGRITVVDPSAGPDHQPSATPVGRHSNHCDPWAFSERMFMAAKGPQLQLIDGEGRERTIHELSPEERQAGWWIHEPRPLVPRKREPAVPVQVDRSQATGRLLLIDAHDGRNMQGVEPGEIKKLLVVESLPKPINYTGGMDPLSYGGTFTLERVVGTVPVEEDGSAYMELPALRSFFFVALDENDLSVKRMQSFLTVMPGETTTCIGCHEQRTRAPTVDLAGLRAMQREPSPVRPIDDVPDVFDFPRDIEPILDRLCVDCHGYEETERGGPYAGGVILTGDRGPMFSHAYYEMTVHRLFSDGRNRAKSNYPPRTLGSSASRILQMIDGSHHGAKATAHERKMLRLWIETGAAYPGTYAALGCGSIGGYQQNNQIHSDRAWPETKAAGEAIRRRCEGCHQDRRVLPRALSDERGVSFWRPNLEDPRLHKSRHVVFNLSRPEKSLMLLAPLARSAGGLGICRPMDSDAAPAESTDEGKGKTSGVFQTTDDPDYRKILAMCVAGKEYLEKITRFDMPRFRPREEYLREMINYGVLPADRDAATPIDPYLLDREYWRSLWHRPSRQ